MWCGVVRCGVVWYGVVRLGHAAEWCSCSKHRAHKILFVTNSLWEFSLTSTPPPSRSWLALSALCMQLDTRTRLCKTRAHSHKHTHARTLTLTHPPTRILAAAPTPHPHPSGLARACPPLTASTWPAGAACLLMGRQRALKGSHSQPTCSAAPSAP